ncbi:MAG TPA: glycoside hydrolase family 2 TIM barrel-domain containing protein, partial [Phototrophicaceae bacterium]|nr:glycoside hydrolase family 2 TIM barrel-domain containing protein [Phototrophicaceae bacterium]
ILDQQEVRFGFRDAVFKDDGFYLNGEHVKLIGLDRHQTYPYIGGAAPKRLQRKDADILKYELGLNIVRTSHYPQSTHFLDRCDEIGLLVLEEIPGWQFIGDDDWKALSLRDVEAMITRDRNHPSIVLWGVRINESPDNEALYKATNKLAHELDPTRQTGGIRNFISSQFLEDVFTYNDFSNTIIEPRVTPHLVTEFMGHMFPTKTFDQEERQIEHAVRHAHIQDKQFGMRNVTGAIGWCAFDYDTHGEFGSGDRICYHGVMDIFRLPKFAAEFYASQSVKEPMLKVASFWTHGDRSTGGNNPLTIFTNCDEVEVFVADKSHGRYQPDRANYPHLPHPPIIVAGITLLLEEYADLHVIGYIDGQRAAEQHIEAGVVPRQLTLKADDAEINADGADMTRLVFKIVDKYGNRLPFAIAVVSFEIEGPGELIGDNPFPLVGGQAALYVKATKQAGTITVRASTPRLAPAEVKITTT